MDTIRFLSLHDLVKELPIRKGTGSELKQFRQDLRQALQSLAPAEAQHMFAELKSLDSALQAVRTRREEIKEASKAMSESTEEMIDELKSLDAAEKTTLTRREKIVTTLKSQSVPTDVRFDFLMKLENIAFEFGANDTGLINKFRTLMGGIEIGKIETSRRFAEGLPDHICNGVPELAKARFEESRPVTILPSVRTSASPTPQRLAS